MNDPKKNVDSEDDEKLWKFTLYIVGDAPASKNAETMLRNLCDHNLDKRYYLTVVDIKNPSASLPPDILAAPTVVRSFPKPERRVIGDLSATKSAIEGLGLKDF
jgi:circadian clock protein KaiB